MTSFAQCPECKHLAPVRVFLNEWQEDYAKRPEMRLVMRGEVYDGTLQQVLAIYRKAHVPPEEAQITQKNWLGDYSPLWHGQERLVENYRPKRYRTVTKTILVRKRVKKPKV